MEIKFDSKTHTYTVNEELASVSVTQLLRKHGLAPDLTFVKKDTLEQKAAAGSYIHAELEHILKDKNYQCDTPEGVNFKKYADEYIDGAIAEQPIAIKWNGMIVAGTADILGFYKNEEWGAFIGDHKTTASINKEYVAWQTSLLDYMFRKLGPEAINGKALNWNGAKEFICFHYAKDGTLEVVKLNKIPDEEIESLLTAESNGEIYQRKELVLDTELKMQSAMIAETIEEVEKRLDQLKAQQKKYNEIIYQAMEIQGIKSVEFDNLKITMVAPTDSIMVDSAKLKKMYPQIWQQCQKISHKNGYLKITKREVE